MSARTLVVVIAVGVLAAAVTWTVVRNGHILPGDAQGPDGDAADRKSPPAEVVGPFWIGVASLEVGENERASRIFNELSRTLPDEPAVWANLGVVRLRLGDLPGAEEALDRAAELAPGREQIVELQAIADSRQGDFQSAIERLRALPDPDVTVLYRLAELLGRTGTDANLHDQLDVYDRIRKRAPENLVAAFGRARLLARAEDGPALTEAIQALGAYREDWGPAAVKQYESAKAAAETGDYRAAAKHLTFLQNLSLATPAYQKSLAALGVTGGSVGRPIAEFLKYRQPPVVFAEADESLRFEETPADGISGPADLSLAFVLDEQPGADLVTLAGGTLHIGDVARLEIGESPSGVGRNALCAIDVNGDFLQDLSFVNGDGLKLWIQDEEHRLSAFEPADEVRTVFEAPATGVWPMDFEADGDMDLVVARDDAAPQVIRNNGDGGFTALDALASFSPVHDLYWDDFDGDGDGDLALLDNAGRVLVSWNNRAGAFADPIVVAESATALTYGDVFAIGRMDLIILEQNGALRNLHFDRMQRQWASRELAEWSGSPNLADAFTTRRAAMHLADLDNNGAGDLVASAGMSVAIWLGQGHGKFRRLEASPDLHVMSIADRNGDGFLDLVGPTDAGAATFRTRGSKGYHWQSIATRTLANLADGRLNSFGIGGRIEIRAGQLAASAPITSPRTHFGLGRHAQVGVARIVWPNGVAQVEFELEADQLVTAVQRLKGSCPWVFAWDGDAFRFVKDFIWRSPLGMRINSQDTAGVDQTEDWILIPGGMLAEEDGAYAFRITAELWETHFFDHISLLVVDHPESVKVFVDERFVPTSQPKLEVIATSPPQPFVEARTESGTDVLRNLAATDGDCVDDFPLGRFQGLAEDHWVEFVLPEDVPVERPVVLIGEGWIYPTDSSLNVAISQGNHAGPRGLTLEVNDPELGWQTVSGNLGFPAGKNKTVVIPLPGESLRDGRRHFRLRTNMEIYWDRLGWAVARPGAEMKLSPMETHIAELRYRGFSKLAPPERRKPDIPCYDRLLGPGPRWRDLEGYYTRFGDVRELLEEIDDRYVIMNAGDEFVLRFAAPAPPPAGWTRDFVLIGDGWVKDGDFNTANSTTVRPLPSHDLRRYGGPPRPLDEDPVYQRNIEDWLQFHTRFVTPSEFERGLMDAARARFEGETS